MGGAEVAIRGIKATVSSSVDVSDRAGRLLGIITSITNPVTVTVSGTPDVNVTDRAARLLGVVYGNVDQLQQRSVTKELLVQLTSAGIQIDTRDRNWDLNFATDQVDVSGSTITTTNVPTTPILDFDQAQSVGRDETDTHTYTAIGNFKLSSIQISASGSVKIEIKAGTSGSEITRMVAFTSSSNPTIQLNFNEELQLTSGQRIQVKRTNRESYSQDIYSTILGFNN